MSTQILSRSKQGRVGLVEQVMAGCGQSELVMAGKEGRGEDVTISRLAATP